MQYAFQTKLTTFQYMASVPPVLKDFNTFMGNTMGARKYWTDWFPIQERLLDGSNETLHLLVDVGGGKGHDVLDFQEKISTEGAASCPPGSVPCPLPVILGILVQLLSA